VSGECGKVRIVRLTRREVLAALGGGAAAAVLAACRAAGDGRSATAAPSPGALLPGRSLSSPPTATPMPSPAEPELAVKAAAMLLVGFRGFDVEPVTAADLARGLGGVVLFDRDQPTGGPRNVESPGQVATLTAGLRAGAIAPLVISTDEEGGRVARLDERHGFPTTRSAAELGAMNDPAATEAAGREMAETLAAAGVNLNLAPVVDLNLNPDSPIIGALDRSFSADPQVVIEQALAFIRGHRAAGVLATLKHFPGHGSATGDTHLGVVDVTETWREVELEPFSAIVDAGMADAILTAHVFNARLDPEHPATLSRSTVTGLLRGDLGYDGVVISDDLQMGAIRQAYGYEKAVRLAIEAGVDVLTIANQQVYDVDVVARTVELIVEMVDAGQLDAARIEEAWRRIQSLRARISD
jgi:beta-N-acetylhexosaminidase